VKEERGRERERERDKEKEKENENKSLKPPARRRGLANIKNLDLVIPRVTISALRPHLSSIDRTQYFLICWIFADVTSHSFHQS